MKLVLKLSSLTSKIPKTISKNKCEEDNPQEDLYILCIQE